LHIVFPIVNVVQFVEQLVKDGRVRGFSERDSVVLGKTDGGGNIFSLL
jgi:hypothetical protein